MQKVKRMFVHSFHEAFLSPSFRFVIFSRSVQLTEHLEETPSNLKMTYLSIERLQQDFHFIWPNIYMKYAEQMCIKFKIIFSLKNFFRDHEYRKFWTVTLFIEVHVCY